MDSASRAGADSGTALAALPSAGKGGALEWLTRCRFVLAPFSITALFVSLLVPPMSPAESCRTDFGSKTASPKPPAAGSPAPERPAVVTGPAHVKCCSSCFMMSSNWSRLGMLPRLSSASTVLAPVADASAAASGGCADVPASSEEPASGASPCPGSPALPIPCDIRARWYAQSTDSLASFISPSDTDDRYAAVSSPRSLSSDHCAGSDLRHVMMSSKLSVLSNRSSTSAIIAMQVCTAQDPLVSTSRWFEHSGGKKRQVATKRWGTGSATRANLHDYPVAVLEQHDIYELSSEERREWAGKDRQQPLADVQHAGDAVLL